MTGGVVPGGNQRDGAAVALQAFPSIIEPY